MFRIDGWADYTEFGAAATSSSPAAVGAVAGVAGYGWLGAKQRSATDATAGLTLMGVRLYNPATGQFTTLDPVPGGNTTAYAYPQDPINMFDLDGGACWSFIDWACSAGKWTWNHRGTIVTIAVTGACIAPAIGWVACAAGQGLVYSVRVQQRGTNSQRVNAAD